MSDKSHIQSIDRAVAVLQQLANRGAQSVSEISRCTGLTLTTVHRLLGTLRANGLVEQVPADGRYRMALRIFEWGQAAIVYRGLREIAKPMMVHLAAELNHTVMVAVPDGPDVVYLDWVPTQHIMDAGRVRTGGRVPAHYSAMGRAMLAALPPDRLEEILTRIQFGQYGPGSPKTLDELRQILETTQRQCYATEKEARQQGYRSVGTIVRGSSGEVVGAIGIGGPLSRMPENAIPMLGARLIESAAIISVHLGYVPHHAVSAGLSMAPY